MKETKEKALLIWSNQEECKVFLIEDPPAWLVKCHGSWINSTDTTEDVLKLLDIVSDALCSNLEHCGDPKHELATKWVDSEISSADSPIDTIKGKFQVIQCGFIV